ncbi:urease accessory protein D [Amaranthus tricolor]|uniref:urease accessory protein D n=1 Tax=Amaranthus tricolor TaxID=29722 RepID=UPI0025910C1F|nr:urease accessory protein D [Amaranthus tricolor]XP_057535001.1 urease accessory protein D [Amaranthus tricolor]
MEIGSIVVKKVAGKSTVIRCFSKYPLRFIVPNKVGNRNADCVWIYSVSYGGGIVSGDSIRCNFTIEDGCTAVLTTQASTKVYKSVGSKGSEQLLEASVGHEALLAVIPDPVTCFATARYTQKQVFRVSSDSNLVLVDWFTSGRYESGERWEFGLYKSTNNIFYEDGQPLFLDTMLLEQGAISSVSACMQDYQVTAMIIVYGPKMKQLQNQVQENVKNTMSSYFQVKANVSGFSARTSSELCLTKPNFIASCSFFGSKGAGLIIRVCALSTEPVYQFLRLQFACLEPVLGVVPYST